MGVRSIECTRDEEGDEQYQKRLLSQRLHDSFPGEPRESQIRGVQFDPVHHGDNPPDARPPWCLSRFRLHASGGPGQSQADPPERHPLELRQGQTVRLCQLELSASN